MGKDKTKSSGLLSGILCAVAIGVCFVGMLIYSKPAGVGVGIGISMCVETVIPSLFVFMVLSSFLSYSPASAIISMPLAPITKHVFGLPKNLGCTVLMSMIGGYPVGARLINQLCTDKQISPKQASFMLCFCCNPSPAFVIAGIGGVMLGNVKAGVIIYAASILSSFVIGMLVKKNMGTPMAFERAGVRRSFSSGVVLAMQGATSAMIIMCGFVLFFCSVIEIIRYLELVPMLCSTLKLGGEASGIVSSCIYGILEVTGGCAECVRYGEFTQLVLLPFFTSFAGLSVIFQIMAMFDDDNHVSFVPFVSSRLLHGFLTAVFAYPFLRKLLSVSSVFSLESSPVPVANSNTPIIILCMLCMCYMVFAAGSKLFIKKFEKQQKSNALY